MGRGGQEKPGGRVRNPTLQLEGMPSGVIGVAIVISLRAMTDEGWRRGGGGQKNEGGQIVPRSYTMEMLRGGDGNPRQTGYDIRSYA